MPTTLGDAAFLARFASGQLAPANRVRKVSGRWFVTDAEDPARLLSGPCFKTKREAMAFAAVNLTAVLERRKEEGR